MTTSDPQFAEFWEPGIRLFVSECDQVILTEPIRSFILEARHDGQRPVLLTKASAHIGWFVADELRNAGGRWVVQDPEGRDSTPSPGGPYTVMPTCCKTETRPPPGCTP